MILQMYQKVFINIYIIFYIFIGIGLIKKYSKNQIKVEKEIFDLYDRSQNRNIIELNEENLKSNPHKKGDGDVNNCENINKEIKYVKYLYNTIKEKILLFKENIIFNNNSKNNNNLLKNEIEKNIGEKNTIVPSIFEIINIIRENHLNNEDINNNNNILIEKENVSQGKKEENNLFDRECLDIFNIENNKENIFEPLPNKNLNLRKSSFMSYFSDIRNLDNFNIEKEYQFE